MLGCRQLEVEIELELRAVLRESDAGRVNPNRNAPNSPAEILQQRDQLVRRRNRSIFT